MGCGASSAAATGAAPSAKNDPFTKDLKEFVGKLLMEENYAQNLLEELKTKENPTNQVEILLKIILSIIDSVSSTTPPRNEMPEFIAGVLVTFLYHLTVKHAAPAKAVDLKALQDPAAGTAYHVDAKWADSVYDKEAAADPKAALVEALAKEPCSIKVAAADILHFRPTSALARPAVAVALDRERQLILVVVRGTANVKDAITDAAGASAPWMDGYAHEAIAMSARNVFEEVRDQVLALKRENPAFGVRTVGHSLGGGTAGLLALAMHRDAEFCSAVYGTVPVPGKKSKGTYRITAVGFGSAAALNKELTEEVHPYVTTVVHDADLVPRLCLANISDFVALADAMVDTFKAVAEDVKKLINGETPEGYDGMKVMKMISKAAKDPAGLVKDLIDEKLDAAADKAEDAREGDETRLYAPGRLLFLAKPEGGGASKAYAISKGSMATGASKILLKGSMLKDHGMANYAHVLLTGEVLPPPP
ncbi:hypothetical protein HYH03_015366 [Edaphochlamys debaryana]|uniref:Fungal lipase-type domain-containing protein n=1 Tax=Edaphochlamys debaryana TaxID=47281 RepID=A0A836BRA4_9CHLO|nr:hypothetical protein HYH03_015366 [Edaphochlamys debaryana]|eukprot:KAG2485922.1 hypothetical protein HYH03_015366 [Edaphochlamys debaryana]